MVNALRGFLTVCACGLALSVPAGQADNPIPPAPPPQGDGRDPARGFGPGPMGFMRGGAAADLESVKAGIRASDEEWKVIGPKLQKVMLARQAADSAINADNSPATDAKGGVADRERGRERGGPGNAAFAGPSTKAGGDFGPGGGPPPGFGPGGGPPPGFGPGGGPPPGFGPWGGPPPGFRPGGGPPPGFGGPDSAVAQALATLRTALADPKTTPQELQQKVAEVRAARQRARRDVANAEKDLLELLTGDQEATLVSLGYID
ncbi:MAG: hypothetical protein NTW87_11685 [Planctomycetota bacterium]|nr:hypothetical protein [Planctomycetota bacterium]